MWIKFIRYLSWKCKSAQGLRKCYKNKGIYLPVKQRYFLTFQLLENETFETALLSGPVSCEGITFPNLLFGKVPNSGQLSPQDWSDANAQFIKHM